ncbi:MAG: ComF family protein [Dehalococcoidia bacterium]|nr:ComF family protein [Dehalococcoidia bacterium]
MKVGPALRRIGETALDAVLPPRCVGCGRFGSFLCDRCESGLIPAGPPRCEICWQPVVHPPTCARCRTQRPAFEGLRAAYVFEGVARELVHALKYRQQRALAAPAAALLARHLEKHPVPFDIVVPVPLHPHRERTRGYNQSALIARGLARKLDVPVAEKALVRQRNTRSQAERPSAEERRANVAGAFAYGGSPLAGRALLVDDVSTTGATLDSCARVLRENGAASVWALTFARED